MSLSDQERSSGIYRAVDAILKEAERAAEQADSWNRKDLARLTELVDRLWPAAIGHQSNSAHWILGSETANVVDDGGEGLWSMMVSGKIEDELATRPPEDREFNPLDTLRIEDFLSAPWHQVFVLYRWTEQLVYYLRRYRDDYLDKRRALSDLVARIQGECFRLLDTQPVHLAYLLHRISVHIYFDQYRNWKDRNDEVDRILKDLWFCHHFKRDLQEFEPRKVMAVHRTLCHGLTAWRKKKLSRHNYNVMRLMAAIEIAGRRLQYVHQHDQMVKILEVAAWTRAEIQNVRTALQTCLKLHEDRKKQEDESHDSDERETFYDWRWEEDEAVREELVDKARRRKKR